MERRRLGPDAYALVSPTLERRGFLAAFTERTGGASHGRYASLNLAFHTDDRHERVRENRMRTAELLAIPELTTIRQVHGRAVVSLDGPERIGASTEGDVLTTARGASPLAILVADCVPVAMASESAGRLAVVHAGWRGLAAGVLQAALAGLGSPGEVVAAIGPGIRSCHYEVGPEVAAAVEAGVPGTLAMERRSGSRWLDLAGTVASGLQELGVREVESAEECTACEVHRFFSHRRDGVTGRQALVAMRM